MKERDFFIDVLKGWGIILVIWGHSSQFLFNEIYSFHMPLFFFLSGCFFNWKMSSKDFVKKKVRQLLIPYFIFFLLSCLYYMILLALTGRFSLETLFMLEGIFPINNEIINTPLWFLYALFWMSLLYYIIRRYFQNDLLIILICLLINVLHYILKENNILQPCFIGRAMQGLLFIHLGYCWYSFYNNTKRATSNKSIDMICFAISFILFVILFIGKGHLTGIALEFYTLLLAVTGIVFTICLFALLYNKMKMTDRILTYLGSRTLCLFALHLPLFEIARPIARYLFGADNFGYDITVFTISLISSIVIGEFLMLLFPRYLGKSIILKYI